MTCPKIECNDLIVSSEIGLNQCKMHHILQILLPQILEVRANVKMG